MFHWCDKMADEERTKAGQPRQRGSVLSGTDLILQTQGFSLRSPYGVRRTANG